MPASHEPMAASGEAGRKSSAGIRKIFLRQHVEAGPAVKQQLALADAPQRVAVGQPAQGIARAAARLTGTVQAAPIVDRMHGQVPSPPAWCSTARRSPSGDAAHDRMPAATAPRGRPRP
jgi:hypothetical protein